MRFVCLDEEASADDDVDAVPRVPGIAFVLGWAVVRG